MYFICGLSSHFYSFFETFIQCVLFIFIPSSTSPRFIPTSLPILCALFSLVFNHQENMLFLHSSECMPLHWRVVSPKGHTNVENWLFPLQQLSVTIAPCLGLVSPHSPYWDFVWLELQCFVYFFYYIDTLKNKI